MAQKLRSITLGAPGFYGLNTELSPVEMPPQFCTTANNCVIDAYGRLGARKGHLVTSDLTENTPRSGEGISNPALGVIEAFSSGGVIYGPVRIFEWNSSGIKYKFACGNNKIWRIYTDTETDDTFVEMSFPVGYSCTGNHWDFADFNGEAYFFQAGHAPLLCNDGLVTVDDLDTLDNQSSETTPNAPEGNIIHAAFGRLWSAGVSATPNTVYWSDTLIGDGWTEGASGSIDVTTVWPNGYDVITSIATHNGRLIIFGKNSILIYSGADDPSTMALEDTIIGTGCVARDSVQNTGEDIVFLSSSGVRLLSRTLSESSLPLGDLTANVRTKIIDDVADETDGINSVYSPEEGFYLLMLEGKNYAYCVDFKQVTDGARRVTVWPGCPFRCFWRGEDGTLWAAGPFGFGRYSGYSDPLGRTYRYQYYSPSMTFDAASNLKFPKKVRPIIIGATGKQATVSWGFGFTNSYNTQVIDLEGSGSLAEYNVAEYNIDEYSATIAVSDIAVNTSGSGREVTLGIGHDVDGSPFSLQEINVQSLIGKLT